ncbi:MAG: hypothetical protein M3416_20220 [Acidobacteriota bacterium]|nr:hypothetical protein [Acidobacteriota bacterium]
MTTPLAHFLTGSGYDLVLPCLFFLGALALAVYLLFRVFAGRNSPGRFTTINVERRSEPTDESGDRSNRA